MGLPSRFQLKQVMRAQKYQEQHADTTIISVDGGSHFVAEQTLPNGARILAFPSLGELLDTLEGRDSA